MPDRRMKPTRRASCDRRCPFVHNYQHTHYVQTNACTKFGNAQDAQIVNKLKKLASVRKGYSDESFFYSELKHPCNDGTEAVGSWQAVCTGEIESSTQVFKRVFTAILQGKYKITKHQNIF